MMTRCISNPRIAVIDLSISGWGAGKIISRMMAMGLVSAGARVDFATQECESAPKGANLLALQPRLPMPGENSMRRLLGKPPHDRLSHALRSAKADIVLPVVLPPAFRRQPFIGWIPDFQHLHIPELYTPLQRKTLNERFQTLSSRASRMWFSSNDAAKDFRTQFPKYVGKEFVANFPSIFAFSPPEGDHIKVRERFRIPERFALVINQFWTHKNHHVVAEAVGMLHGKGLRIPLIMAGIPSDYRDRENSALSATLQSLSQSGAWADSRVLGKLDRAEIEGLLRSATVLIQPSRFEGWNTSVEDAKALGCPVILSDIPVHREQCPEALGFFGCNDAAALAAALELHWNSLPTRPDVVRERDALAVASAQAARFGRQMFEICKEAVK